MNEVMAMGGQHETPRRAFRAEPDARFESETAQVLRIVNGAQGERTRVRKCREAGTREKDRKETRVQQAVTAAVLSGAFLAESFRAVDAGRFGVSLVLLAVGLAAMAAAWRRAE